MQEKQYKIYYLNPILQNTEKTHYIIKKEYQKQMWIFKNSLSIGIPSYISNIIKILLSESS